MCVYNIKYCFQLILLIFPFRICCFYFNFSQVLSLSLSLLFLSGFVALSLRALHCVFPFIYTGIGVGNIILFQCIYHKLMLALLSMWCKWGNLICCTTKQCWLKYVLSYFTRVYIIISMNSSFFFPTCRMVLVQICKQYCILVYSFESEQK